MSIVTYSYARQNLARLMDEVERDRAPIYISRQNKSGGAVLLALDDFEALETTLYLLSSPANAADLRSATEELSRGKGVERKLSTVKKPLLRK